MNRDFPDQIRFVEDPLGSPAHPITRFYHCTGFKQETREDDPPVGGGGARCRLVGFNTAQKYDNVYKLKLFII